MAPYAFSWNTASRANGSVVLEARAIDAKGNVGSHKVTVTVANATVKSCNGNGKNACKESVAYGGGEH
jgi:hypothetical protein